MLVKHQIEIHSTCPVNGDTDLYQGFVYVRDRVLTCEEVAGVVADLTRGPVFQEQLTQDMADRLQARVKTVGRHTAGNIRTTVLCNPRPIRHLGVLTCD